MKKCLICGTDCLESFALYRIMSSRGPGSGEISGPAIKTYDITVWIDLDDDEEVMGVCPSCLGELISQYASQVGGS